MSLFLLPVGSSSNRPEADSESSAFFRSIVRRLGDLLAVLDADHRVRYANPAFADTLAGDPERLVGRRLAAWVHPDDAAPVSRVLQRVLAGAGRSRRVTFRGRRGDGVWRTFEAVVDLLSEAETGTDPHVVLVVRDMTDAGRREQALQRERDALRALLRRTRDRHERMRNRAGRALHDGPGEALAVLRGETRWLQANGPHDDVVFQRRAERAVNLIDETVRAVRTIDEALRPGPLDHGGLGAALTWAAQRAEAVPERRCRFVDATGPALNDIDPDLATTLFRIFDEALVHGVGGAGASPVEARLLLRDARLLLELHTRLREGRGGAEDRSAGLDLLDLQERLRPWGGMIHVHSLPGKHTITTVSVPVGRLSLMNKAYD